MDPMTLAVPLDVLLAALRAASPPPPPAPLSKTVAGFGRAKTPPAPATRKVSTKVVGFATATN